MRELYRQEARELLLLIPLAVKGGLCVCVYVAIPFILDVKLLYAPVGVTQEEGHWISSSSFCGACPNFYRGKDSV